MTQQGSTSAADQAALRFFNEAGSAPRLDTLLSAFEPVAEALGFGSAACFHLAKPGEPICPRVAFRWNLSASNLGWLRSRLSAADPAMRAMLMSPEAAPLPMDGRSEGLNGWLIPIHGPLGETLCVVVMSSGSLDLDAKQRMNLQVAATLLANQGVKLAECEAEVSPSEEPTAREAECADWMARGKSDWEIGQILGMHEGTVAFHLDTLKTKLNLSRRAEIPARLARLGSLSDDEA